MWWVLGIFIAVFVVSGIFHAILGETGPAAPGIWTPDRVFKFLNHRLNNGGFNIYTVGTGWGRRIGTEQEGGILHWGEEIFSHTGWWTPKPTVGDLIVRQGSSGFWIASMFTEVRHAGKVPDLFFAKSAPITRSDDSEQWGVLFRDYPKVLALSAPKEEVDAS